MKNYKLKDTETVLFRGNAVIYTNHKRQEEGKIDCDILLTNLGIVISYPKKKVFRTVVESFVYKIADVKIFNDQIQIIRKKTNVDIFLKNCELYLSFAEENVTKAFCNKALTLISGNSQFVRAIKKTQKIITETGEALAEGMAEVAKTAENVITNTKSAVFAVKNSVGVLKPGKEGNTSECN